MRLAVKSPLRRRRPGFVSLQLGMGPSRIQAGDKTTYFEPHFDPLSRAACPLCTPRQTVHGSWNYAILLAAKLLARGSPDRPLIRGADLDAHLHVAFAPARFFIRAMGVMALMTWSMLLGRFLSFRGHPAGDANGTGFAPPEVVPFLGPSRPSQFQRASTHNSRYVGCLLEPLITFKLQAIRPSYGDPFEIGGGAPSASDGGRIFYIREKHIHEVRPQSSWQMDCDEMFRPSAHWRSLPPASFLEGVAPSNGAQAIGMSHARARVGVSLRQTDSVKAATNLPYTIRKPEIAMGSSARPKFKVK
ncbi:uncharacterized protein CCOS01_00537 [Colletotrichum costaricense]|uniref:Uncharacterized protein n=1 Tax=Colletotrichum costaricense TaxID=1209916 RepID=A0AAJ0E823_9PEZI|nr:uncharacterized protein CCOS01_00537 [Colletotrichum costaricense]KAK1539223.1 hypothetical protein CCOS01_00537 [Colletotrichum costaricense]